MGIVIYPSVPNLEDRVYLAFKRTNVMTRTHKLIDASACGFDLMNCKLPIPQFVDVNDTDDKYKNDSYHFLVEKETGQTVVITLTNNSTDEATTITDDSYGQFFDFGSYSQQPLVAGVIIDWCLVQAEFGFGCYNIKVEIFNEDEVLSETPIDICFDVRPFSCASAHGTIRFETIQTGYIHNGFDYRGIYFTGSTGKTVLGWKQQIRWYGIMLPDIPDEESDYITMSTRKESQIQEKITGKYKIELYRVQSAFGKHLTNDNFLATQLYVSDYNLNNYEVYRDKHLRKVKTDNLTANKLNSGVNLSFTFKEVDEGTVKRVYG